jgi:hypothetical protein
MSRGHSMTTAVSGTPIKIAACEVISTSAIAREKCQRAFVVHDSRSRTISTARTPGVGGILTPCQACLSGNALSARLHRVWTRFQLTAVFEDPIDGSPGK